MNEQKHTPGPWWLDYSDDVDLPNHVGISSKRHGLLAQVVWRMEGEESNPRCEATANLIAAAPDLLDALKSFPGFTDDAAIGDLWIQKMRSAIAKATGEAA